MIKSRQGATGVLALSVVLVLSAYGWTTSAGAAEGQLTQIGGNGPTGCDRTDAEIGLNRPPPPSGGIAGKGFKNNPGMQGIASDLKGGLYLAYGNQIFDRTLTIGGVVQPLLLPGKPLPPPARQDDGAPASETDLSGLEAIAVHPSGGTLWVALAATSILDSNLQVAGTRPPLIRGLDLTDTKKPVTTVKTLSVDPVAIAADGSGNLYVADEGGEIYKLDGSGNKIHLGTVPSPTGVAVDIKGGQLYVASTAGGNGQVYRLNGSSRQLIADRTVIHQDSGSPSLSPRGLAIGHETDGQDVIGRYLYIADFGYTDLETGKSSGRVLRADLKDNPPTITTVGGGGPGFVDHADDARTASLAPKYLAADMAGHVYIAASDQCAIFMLQTPSPFRQVTAATNPPGPTNTTLPPNNGQTGDNNQTAADTVGNNQANNGTVQQQGTNQTQIVPGSETVVQPQTELRVIDQGNVVATPEQAAQPTVEPVPTPGPAAQFTPTPAASPTPTPTPAADAGSVVVSDPGPTSAAAAATSPVVPPAPAAAPVPPAPASSPPPAAQQPVSNPGLVHGDSGAAPTRGATRYAMVRNDEEQSLAALAMAGAGAMAAVFLCVMFVAPGASSKPKPRPKGAY
jgi:hypothetical protein